MTPPSAVYDKLQPYRSAFVMPDVIRHPEAGSWGWIPAFAGMTGGYTES